MKGKGQALWEGVWCGCSARGTGHSEAECGEPEHWSEKAAPDLGVSGGGAALTGASNKKADDKLRVLEDQSWRGEMG